MGFMAELKRRNVFRAERSVIAVFLDLLFDHDSESPHSRTFTIISTRTTLVYSVNRRILAIIFILFSALANAQTSAVQDSKEAINTILENAIRDGIPGLSMAVANRDGLIWTSTAGYADVGSRVPVTTDHLFGIGSITKTFVAVVTLQLVEEGRLALDQTPQEILGTEVVGRVANADRATIAQLLNHTSGVPSWEDDARWIREGRGDRNAVGRIWNRTDTLAYLEGVPPTNEPGKEFSYSNTNHTLIGLIIEKISGNDTVDEIASRILTPTGISDIFLEGFQAVPHDRLASRYHYATPEFRRDVGVHDDFPEVSSGLIDASSSNLSVEWTAGGMVVTASDLAKYAAAYRAGTLLTPDSMAFVQDWVRVDDTLDVGHGLFRRHLPKGQIIGHTGSVLGFTGAMFWHETEDIAVAIVANVGTMHIGQDLPGAYSVLSTPYFWELILTLSN